jgi:hypothetical protein
LFAQSGRRGLRRQFQDRAKKTVPRFADLELSGMNSHRQSSCAGSEIVAGQRALVFLGEPPLRVQGKRMSGNNLTGK